MPLPSDAIEDALRRVPYYVPKEALAPIYTRSRAAEEAARAVGVDPTWGEAERPMVSLPNLPALGFRALNMATGLVNKGLQKIWEPEFTGGGGQWYPGGPVHPGLWPGGRQYLPTAADVGSQLFMMGLMGGRGTSYPEWAGANWPAPTLTEIAPQEAARLSEAGRATEIGSEYLPPQIRSLLSRAGLLGGARAVEQAAPETAGLGGKTGFLPRGPATAIPPELETQPYRLHGTESPIYRMVDPSMITERGQRMGPGFYTTDKYHVAEGYTHPSIGGKSGPLGPIYRVFEVQPVKFLDAEQQPVPEQALQRLAARFKDERWLAFRGQPAENIFKRFSDYSDQSYERNQALVEELQKEGFGGLRHTGGQQVGNIPRTSHEVKVYWDPERQIRIRALDATTPPPVVGGR